MIHEPRSSELCLRAAGDGRVPLVCQCPHPSAILAGVESTRLGFPTPSPAAHTTLLRIRTKACDG